MFISHTLHLYTTWNTERPRISATQSYPTHTPIHIRIIYSTHISYYIHYTYTQPATQNAHEQAQQSHSHHIHPPPHTQTNTHTYSYIIYITYIIVSYPSHTHTTCNREGPRTSATKSRPRALASSFSRAGF